MEFKNRLGKPCTASQYITDILMKRRAEKENKTLPLNYYKVEPWAKHYKQTIVRVNSLLKMYKPEVIVAALNDPKGKNIYSLGAKWLDEILEKKEKEFQQKEKAKELTEINLPKDEKPQKPRQQFTNNILNKLK